MLLSLSSYEESSSETSFSIEETHAKKTCGPARQWKEWHKFTDSDLFQEWWTMELLKWAKQTAKTTTAGEWLT